MHITQNSLLWLQEPDEILNNNDQDEIFMEQARGSTNYNKLFIANPKPLYMKINGILIDGSIKME